MQDINQPNFSSVAWFRPELLEYYQRFWEREENETLTVDQVVTYVNIGLYHDFYELITFVPDSSYYGVLVNKFFRSSADFSPDDLEFIGIGGPQNNVRQYARSSAAQGFFAMRDEMENLGLPIIPRSGYRPYTVQRQIVENNLAVHGPAFVFMWNAQPGHSEHQLGLAIDIIQPGHVGSLGAANFQNTAQYAWMLQNAHRFGFILSYPYDYSYVTGYAYEPWHWRFVGEARATYMFEQNIPTLDHYWATRVVYIPISLDLPETSADYENVVYGETYEVISELPVPTVSAEATGPDTAMNSEEVTIDSSLGTESPVLFSLGDFDIGWGQLGVGTASLLVALLLLSLIGMRRRRRQWARLYDFDSRTAGYRRRKAGSVGRGSGRRNIR